MYTGSGEDRSEKGGERADGVGTLLVTHRTKRSFEDSPGGGSGNYARRVASKLAVERQHRLVYGTMLTMLTMLEFKSNMAESKCYPICLCLLYRDRKERKHYIDDWALGDEEIEGRRSFHLDEKIETDRFPQCFVKEMQGIGYDESLHFVVRHLVTVLRPRAPLGREAERSSGKRTHYATPTPFSPRSLPPFPLRGPLDGSRSSPRNPAHQSASSKRSKRSRQDKGLDQAKDFTKKGQQKTIQLHFIPALSGLWEAIYWSGFIFFKQPLLPFLRSEPFGLPLHCSYPFRTQTYSGCHSTPPTFPALRTIRATNSLSNFHPLLMNPTPPQAPKPSQYRRSKGGRRHKARRRLLDLGLDDAPPNSLKQEASLEKQFDVCLKPKKSKREKAEELERLKKIDSEKDFNLAYLQKHGFNMPLLFRDKAGLGLRVPSSNFSVNDVRMCVVNAGWQEL
uniref:Uncharacterized protein n=1 Tax=Timema cristinae TaxID=61476 RepID=A0A7R9CR91_TIMCR|nr:unnamed protein product [Timema cristinae]